MRVSSSLRPLKFEIFDFEESGNHKFMGMFQATINELVRAAGSSSHLEVIEPAVRAKKSRSYINSGTVRVEAARVERRHTFVSLW